MLKTSWRMMDTTLGKKAEQKVKEWLDRPNEGYCFDRLPDQMTGFYGSSNICDFTLFKFPNLYYLESKATWEDSFPFSMITEYQYTHMLEKSRIRGVTCYIVVLFASYQRAFLLNIQDIDNLQQSGRKSINIKKIDKWTIPYQEIKTVPNNRKELLDYDKNNNVL